MIAQTGSDSTIPRPRVVTVTGWIAAIQGLFGLIGLAIWVFALHGDSAYIRPASALGFGFARHLGFGILMRDGSPALSHTALWSVLVPLGLAWSALNVVVGFGMLIRRNWARTLYILSLVATAVLNLVLWGSLEFVGLVYLYVVYRLLNEPQAREYFASGPPDCENGQPCAES